MWQRSPFDVSLLEEDPPFGELARFELRLENREQRRRIRGSGRGGRKQGVGRQFLLAECPTEIGKFGVRIKQHDHECLAVTAQIPCRKRIRWSAVCAALGKRSVAEFGLQVAGICPRPTRQQRRPNLYATPGAFAMIQSEHDRAEERHGGGVIAHPRPWPARSAIHAHDAHHQARARPIRQRIK